MTKIAFNQVDGMAVSVLDYGVDPTGATDDTAKWVLAEAAAEGKVLIIPEGTYLKDRTFPKSNTTYWFEPGVTMNGTTGGNNLWRFFECSDVHFYGNGATFNRDATGTSANIYFSIANRCSLRDCNIVGGGSAKDGIYVGGGAVGTFSTNIHIIGGSVTDANRNGISIVSAQDTIIEGVEISGTTGGPGAGIDLEANGYGGSLRTTIRNCQIHDNAQSGIGGVFADFAWIYDNHIYDNGGNGIGVAAGGTQFDDAIARTQDLRGVGSFTTGTGTIGVNSASQDSDAGLDIGDVIQFDTRNGATLPAELQAQLRWVVAEKPAGNNSIILGTAYEYGKVTSFSDAGSGTLTLDPDTSDIQMVCYNQEGQNSNFHIYDNLLENNGGTTDPEISISTGANFKVHGNTIYSSLDKTLALRVQYSTNVDVYDNNVYMDRASTAQASGISFGTSSNISTSRNRIFFASGDGLTVSGCSRGRFVDDVLTNCGNVSNRAMRMQSGVGAKLSPIIRQDTKNTPTYGLVLESTVSTTLVTGANCSTAGSSNANSILDSGTGNLVINSIQNDGTFRP